MADSTPENGADVASSDLVLFAYDGSELAAFAIEQAGKQLAPGREALVVCVWQPADVGFEPSGGRQFDADDATRVRQAAEETAADGARLALAAGFRASSAAVQAAPTWQGVVRAAEQHDASLVVLGSHCRTGLAGRLLGSVAGAVVSHCKLSVLVVHRPS